MQTKSEVQQGWEFATALLGADVATHMGAKYVSDVEAAIKQLEDNINNHKYRNLGIGQLQGFMLEEWSAGTFNIDAIAKDSKDRAVVLYSTEKNSVDIHLKSGTDYSAKSYRTAKQTVKAQARFNPETGQASYKGQGRLVPSNLVEGGKQIAHKEALRNESIREDLSKAYYDTEVKLTDKIANKKGVESKPASRKDLDKMAKESKKREFKSGITAKSEIQTVKNALKAGYTTAAITVALQLAPEIYKFIDFLIKNGELDISQVKDIGEKGISAGTEGFLQGSIAATLQIMCSSGKFGEALIGIKPEPLGAIVSIVLQTAKNSILVAAGKISSKQMGASFINTVVVSSGYLAAAKIGGAIGQSLGFNLPVIGYLLGSLVGTSLCVVYGVGKRQLISFCIDTGFTCFGLVEQSYELPEEVLHEIGVDTITIPRTKIETTEIAKANIDTVEINKVKYETIDITVLRRGIIGVNKIGYII